LWSTDLKSWRVNIVELYRSDGGVREALLASLSSDWTVGARRRRRRFHGGDTRCPEDSRRDVRGLQHRYNAEQGRGIDGE
jgi:hypothetical protein